MSTAEPFGQRWKRRAVTIPMMLGATAAATLALPIAIPASVLWDLGRRRWRLPSLRMYLFLVQYALNDSAEILAAGPLWLLAGAGRRLRQPASIHRHERLQRWSVDVLARRAASLLGVRVELEPDTEGVLEPGPVIVLCRHVSLLDSSLPLLLYHARGFHVRSVIMAEMLADPGFDLLYRRLGSIFITRDNGAEARQEVRALAGDLDSQTALVIYPEGRLFRADVLRRSSVRLVKTDPQRAERLAGLRHVLPPRPGGVLALLDGAPHADVVVIGHVGLDTLPSVADLADAVPLSAPVRVAVWRTPRADIPTDAEGRTAWLDDQWLRLDEWVDEHRPTVTEPVARDAG